MIPLQLTLKNFLSYRDATLDFSGLHTACICGSNGAGKSSLLEAITWAIWGQSRAATEDDVIFTGAKDARVDFTFQTNQQIYRIIRTRQRGQSSSLEFQVASGDSPNSGFKSLSERGLRATQQLVNHHLKLDYDTFINSAYLRQGRADEFMLRRPNERKQILADLLKLNHYEQLAEQAKEKARELKILSEQLEQNLESIQVQLEQREAIASEQAALETHINTLQEAQAVDHTKLQSLQAVQHQRQTWEQQLTFIRQQYQHQLQDCDRLQQEIGLAKLQQQQLETILAQADEITNGHTQYNHLQAQEDKLDSLYAEYNRATEQRRQIQHQQEQKINQLNKQLQQAQAQLEALREQEQECVKTLSRTEEVEAAITQLQQARHQLAYLDQLQLQVSPLTQRRNQLQTQVDRAHARLSARLEELRTSANRLETEQQRQPQLRQAVLEVGMQIEQLEKKQVYQQRVQEKGLEKRSFRERLQETQRNYEKQIAELVQKIDKLSEPNAVCPLCDRPMDAGHNHKVVEKTLAQQEELEHQFWVVREQLARCDLQLQELRDEYRQLVEELAPYTQLLEQRGKLLEQLEANSEEQSHLQQLLIEVAGIENSLQAGNYATEVQQELADLDQQLQTFNYDDKNHALARNEVERWRWAEIKQAELKQAQRRQAQLAAQVPELINKITHLEQQITLEQTDSESSKQILDLDRYITEIGYDPSQHNAVRVAVRKAQSWQLRAQELKQAQQQYPILLQKTQDLAQSLQARSQAKEELQIQIDAIIRQLEQLPDISDEIKALDRQIFERRRELDTALGQLGRLQQQTNQLEIIQTQYQQQQKQLQTARQQYRVYQELTTAFGKNGIQALMIENVLPQLEAETNALLARLSGNQLHVQFVTQKAGRSASRSKKATKLIDTLDILIADARGTRPYETYSGGEAFRINFSIRLALARLLAQRAGTALQMLIVDEGFGTQDQEGCDRLIAAVNAIASDFACILTVTHMPYFKEAFQARIEVYKTQNGSQLSLSI